MGFFERQFRCVCVAPNRDPDEGNELPVEGDDNLPLG